MLILVEMSSNELLNYAITNGMIDMSTIQAQIEMNERKKYLNMHNSKIWKSTDGNWYTYLQHDKERRLVKRKTEKALQDKIIEHYKQKENEPDIKSVFYEWIDRKLHYGEIQKQTYDRYLIEYNKYFMGTSFEKRKIKYLEENALEDFIMDAIKEHNLTSKAYGNMRTIIRGLLLFAKKRKYTSLNVNMFFSDLDISKKVFRKNVKHDDEIVFTGEEIRQIIAFLENEKAKITNLGVIMAIFTGMRVGEIVALKWEDIHDDFIHVNRRQVYYKDDSGKRIYEIQDFPKTEAGIRDVVIVPELKLILRKLKSINPFTEYVFEKNGKPVSIHSLAMVLYRACDHIGIKRRGMHSLRKTYATMLINSGVDESIVINQMGHTDINTTKDYYYYNNQTKGNIKKILSEAINY